VKLVPSVARHGFKQTRRLLISTSRSEFFAGAGLLKRHWRFAKIILRPAPGVGCNRRREWYVVLATGL
jgi:hypothetical protein